jgi:hypothetical protein
MNAHLAPDIAKVNTDDASHSLLECEVVDQNKF